MSVEEKIGASVAYIVVIVVITAWVWCTNWWNQRG
jgi:hypothetical protein